MIPEFGHFRLTKSGSMSSSSRRECILLEPSCTASWPQGNVRSGQGSRVRTTIVTTRLTRTPSSLRLPLAIMALNRKAANLGVRFQLSLSTVFVPSLSPAIVLSYYSLSYSLLPRSCSQCVGLNLSYFSKLYLYIAF